MKARYLVSVALCSTVVAQSPPNNPPVPPARGPTLDLALEAARAALEHCVANGHNVAVGVVDAAGVRKVLLAADGASPRGVQSANNKAVTALTFKAPTSQLSEQVKSDKDFAEKVAANTEFNVRAGGVLLRSGNEIIGAIGVGGARGSENDEACALAGVNRIQSRLR